MSLLRLRFNIIIYPSHNPKDFQFVQLQESSDSDDDSDDSGESRNRVPKNKDNGDDDSSVVGDADGF